MSSLMQRKKAKAKRKGTLAAATAVGGVAALVVGAPVLGVIGLAGGAILGYDWFSYRVRSGLRF